MDMGLDLEIVVKALAKDLGQSFNPNIEGAFKNQDKL